MTPRQTEYPRMTDEQLRAASAAARATGTPGDERRADVIDEILTRRADTRAILAAAGHKAPA